MKNKSKRKLEIVLGIIVAIGFYLLNENDFDFNNLSFAKEEIVEEKIENYNEIVPYSGNSYIILNDNIPSFTNEELNNYDLESYSEFDSLNRCGRAVAVISKEDMPTEKRGSIGMIKPSGWHTVKYSIVDGKYLYNRCHLIGYQLTGQNANELNLITCTRQMNVGTMLDFENKVAEYVKNTNNHVAYSVTPYFENQNLLATGVQMEAYSIEDDGEGIKFNVFVYNVQDGIEINYLTGESKLVEES